MAIKPIHLPINVNPLKDAIGKSSGGNDNAGIGTLSGIGGVGGKAEAFAGALRDALKTGGSEALDSLSQLTMGNQFMGAMSSADAGQLAELNELNMLMDSMAGETSIGGGNLFAGMLGNAMPGGMPNSDISRIAEMVQQGIQDKAQPTEAAATKPEPANYMKTAGADAVSRTQEVQSPQSVQAPQAPSAPEAPRGTTQAQKINNPIGMHLARAAGYLASSGQTDMLQVAKNALAQKAYGGSSVSKLAGLLSSRFESNGDPGTVAYDRVGGTSYGTYQIASRTGSFDQFVGFLDKEAPDLAKRLSAGGNADTGSASGPMPSAWRAIAHEQPERFSELQHKFIEKSHFNPALKKISQMTGIDLSGRHQAVSQVLWSTAVQHGASGSASIFAKALQAAGSPGGASFEQNLIKEVYANRSNQFGSSTERVQGAVKSRFKQEMKAALSLLGSSALLDSNA